MAYALVQKCTSVNNPTCAPQRSPFKVHKRDIRPFSKGNRKGQLWHFVSTTHWGRRLTQSQKEPSGLPVPCHLGGYSKCFILPRPNATMFLKQNKNKATSCSFCSQAVTCHLCLGYNRFKARSHGSSIQDLLFAIFFPTYIYRHNMLTEALLFLQEKWIADYRWFYVNKRL